MQALMTGGTLMNSPTAAVAASGRQLTLAGRRMHAELGGAPRCGPSAAGEETSADWSQVTCPDCCAEQGQDDGAVCGPVLAVLAEAHVLTALAGAGALPEAGITRRVDAGYQALVPAALARLAGQGLVEEAGGRGQQRTLWRLAG